MDRRRIPVQKDLSFIEEVESRFEEDLQKFSHLDPSMCAVIKEEDEDEPGLSDRAQFEQGLLRKMNAVPPMPKEEEKVAVFTNELPEHLQGSVIDKTIEAYQFLHDTGFISNIGKASLILNNKLFSFVGQN
jgi:hypothetical protein